MAKGDDTVARKKNKAIRKKLNGDNSSSKVSARVASIIAAKRRRQSGKRRMCQGMCFSLPTPDDPFNDRHGKMDFEVKDKKKIVSSKVKKQEFVKGRNTLVKEETLDRKNGEMDNVKQKNEKLVNLRSEMKKPIISSYNLGQKSPINSENAEVWLNDKDCNQHGQAFEYSYCPSKFFIMCLNVIEKALRHAGTYNDEDRPLFVNPWGVEFLKFCSIGKDILETSGSVCTIEQIAWIVSIAADAIARKEKEGLSFAGPFLLFLVPSQEKATKVRLVCKPLKELGIHTVSLHPGASLDHQICGLKSCEPEFLVSTPERLMELVSLKAIDISGVSFLVVDGFQSLHQDGSLSALGSIRQSILGNPQTVVFNDSYNYACVPALQNLFLGPICRLSLKDSICSQSACIVQRMEMCSSDEEKLSKGMEVLRVAFDNRLCSQYLKVLFIVENDSKSTNLVKILKSNGYSVSTGSSHHVSDAHTSLDPKPLVSIVNAEHISATDLGVYEIVILPNFVSSTDSYIQILTRMARHSTHGILHSFMTKEDEFLSGPVIKILEQCGQAVPEVLRSLHLRSSVSE